MTISLLREIYEIPEKALDTLVKDFLEFIEHPCR
jgi:hypothetical protein